MKPRSIAPSFWEDLDVIELSRDERLLLVAMITAGADDHGRLKANAAYLKRLAFAFDADIDIPAVDGMICDIGARCKNVRFYVVNGERYAVFVNWEKYQQIKYKAKSMLPDPPLEQLSQLYPTSAKVSETAPKFPKPPLGSVELGSEAMSSVAVDSVGATEPIGDGGNGRPKPPEQEPEPERAQAGAVFRAWELARGGLMNHLDAEQLDDLRAEYGSEWCIAAIHEANASRNGKTISLNFVRAILARWGQEGFKSKKGGTGPPGSQQAAVAGKHEVAEAMRKQLKREGIDPERIEAAIKQELGEGY